MSMKLLIFIIVGVFFVPSSWAQFDQLQSLSLAYNPAFSEPPELKPTYLEYLEIPKAWVTLYQERGLTPEWSQQVRVSGSSRFYKLLIHPFDSTTVKEMRFSLKKQGYDDKVHRERRPFLLTESRSLFPAQPSVTGVAISPRLSMTDGFGDWNGREREGYLSYDGAETLSKLISVSEAEFGFRASQIVQSKLGGTSGEYFEFLPDRMSLIVDPGPKDFSKRAMTFRDVSYLAQPNQVSIPGFTVLHEIGGPLLALVNGYTEPEKFVIEKVAPAIGRGWAEFIFRTQFVHSSPHMQNVLFTADDLLRMNTKLIIRDGSDLIPLIEASEYKEIMDRYQDSREALQMNFQGTKDFFVFRHAINHGSNFSIFRRTERISDAVHLHFLKQLAAMSGVSFKDVKSISKANFSESYAELTLDKNNEIWQRVQSGLARPSQRSVKKETLREDLKETTLRERVADIESGNLKGLPSSVESLKALLIAKFKGHELSDSDKERIAESWVPWFSSVQRMSFQASWIAGALVTLDALSEDLIPKVLRHLRHPSYQNLLFQLVAKKYSVKANVLLLNELAQRGIVSYEARFYLDKIASKIVDFHSNSSTRKTDSRNWRHPEIIEAVYFSHRKARPTEPMTEFIKLKMNGPIPDSIMRDLAQREVGKGLGWIDSGFFKQDPRYVEFIAEAKKGGRCYRAVRK
ncbi:MAG: hypothetical protein KDD61_08835 [Bdellovibrionales bacterium]|nr:hypothetical protein [Bdellovibrionales bacterium]